MIDDLDGVAATAKFSLLFAILRWSEWLALRVGSSWRSWRGGLELAKVAWTPLVSW